MTALPAGYYYDGSYIDAGENASFWSATESDNGFAYGWGMYASVAGFSGNYRKYYGHSVRCFQDSE